MGEHTKTPWAEDPDDRPGMEWNIHIVEAARPHMRIAFTSNGPDSEANAAFIVKAVNNHEALVKALEDARDFLDPDRSPPRLSNRDMVAKINALLVDVGGSRE